VYLSSGDICVNFWSFSDESYLKIGN